jgi:hypothetical protein
LAWTRFGLLDVFHPWPGSRLPGRDDIGEFHFDSRNGSLTVSTPSCETSASSAGPATAA